MSFDSNGSLQVVAGAGSGLTLLAIVLRYIMKNVRADRLEAMVVDAEKGSYGRMVTELKRVSEKCDALEKKIAVLNENQLLDAYDLSALTILLSSMPCGECKADVDQESFQKARDAVIRIERRRNLRAENDTV